jgi:SWI/SNF-related matrix-associated actin-dependent regulator of chromatin subfamily A3
MSNGIFQIVILLPGTHNGTLTHCSVVFSTWRLTLDIVQTGLDQASLRSIRFDGKVPQEERQSVIDEFKADPAIRVMLLTLSCGAVG